MTDITELAPAMKAAAEKASGGDWVKESGDGWDAICSNDDQANGGFIIADFVGPDSASNREFMQLANPANVLALVEALDKAQAKATQQGNIASALFDEVTQLRLRADEKAPELRAQLIEADSELEALRQRISELEFIRTSADTVQREFANELGCAGDNESILQAIEDLKQQSESRTVTVKLPRPGFVTISGQRTAVYLKGDVDAAMLAAGIEETE